MALFSRTPKKEGETPPAALGIGSRVNTNTSSTSSTASMASSSSSSSSASPAANKTPTQPANNTSFFSRLMGGAPRAVPGGLRASSHSRGSMEGLSSLDKPPSSVASATSASSQASATSASSSHQTRSMPVRSSAAAPHGDSTGGTNTASNTSNTPTAVSSVTKKPYRTMQFERIIDAENVDDSELRDTSWRGVPTVYRPLAWQIMIGYAPTNRSRRDGAVGRKRKEYADAIPVYFNDSEGEEKTPQELNTLDQIRKDLPRTCPDILFFHQSQVQAMMERILYIWSIRHPASGYVQGMNDILTALLVVSFQPYVPGGSTTMEHSTDVLKVDISGIKLSTDSLLHIEADAYWKFSKLMDGVQDHYTHSQPGLQRMILRLEDLMSRHCPSLNAHFEKEGVQYMQFAFRWMNCFLMRELPLSCVLRLWDTYFAEQRAGFETFHVNVCAVLLKIFEEQLMEMNFQGMLMLLQDLPTNDWGSKDMDEMLSQAFILSTLYDGSTHLG